MKKWKLKVKKAQFTVWFLFHPFNLGEWKVNQRVTTHFFLGKFEFSLEITMKTISLLLRFLPFDFTVAATAASYANSVINCNRLKLRRYYRQICDQRNQFIENLIVISFITGKWKSNSRMLYVRFISSEMWKLTLINVNSILSWFKRNLTWILERFVSKLFETE